MQGCFNISKSMNVLCHINGMKDLKNHMIISIDAEKACDQIQKCPPTKKNHPTTKTTTKAVYDKPTANITLSGERLKAFPLKSGTRVLTPSTLTQESTGNPSQSNQARKRNKVLQIRKEEVKLSVCS